MSTCVLHTVGELRRALTIWRRQHPDGSLGFVPTMGALHEGHLGLVDRALRDADEVIVSIFVNPTQFGADEDFSTYPRTLETDRSACESRGVRWIFAPSAAEMYPDGDETIVEVPTLSSGLCGVERPHFFRGVARVVLKLLNIVGADLAVFGEKDFQQLQVIRQMARDVHHPTMIISAPTKREADGLAMSSRNRNLTAAERRMAAAIPAALQAAAAALADISSPRAADLIVAKARTHLETAGARIAYLTVVKSSDLAPATDFALPTRIMVAVWCGQTRLIDNIAVKPLILPDVT